VLNLRGAWLHLVGDALGSLAALVAAIAIRLGSSPAVDPMASFVVAAILVYGGARLLKDAVFDPARSVADALGRSTDVRKTVLATPGVAELHDLHVWTLGAGHEAITGHVRSTSGRCHPGRPHRGRARDRYHVEYVTIQVEVGGVTCQAEAVDA